MCVGGVGGLSTDMVSVDVKHHVYLLTLGPNHDLHNLFSSEIFIVYVLTGISQETEKKKNGTNHRNNMQSKDMPFLRKLVWSEHRQTPDLKQ